MNWQLENGTRLAIKQNTQYPWEGKVDLTITPASPQEFTLFVRIPGWSKENTVAVNGHPITGAAPGKYLPIKRRWSSGDTVELNFDMQPRAVHANLAVADDRGRIAFQRGPIVYCMEQLDQAVGAADTEGFPRYTAQLTETTTAAFRSELLDGVVVLEHPGEWLPAEPGGLYQATMPMREPVRPAMLRMIPYYGWSNRQLSAMQVWIPYRQA
jgi:DUF1680 family protein